MQQQETGGDGVGINSGDESSIVNKKWRCVEVNIYVKEEESKTIQAAVTENVISGGTSPDNSLSENHELNLVNGDTTNIGLSRIPTWLDLSSNKFFDTSEKFDRITDIRLNKMNDGINGLTLNNREPYRAVKDMEEYASNYNRGKSDYNHPV